MRPPFPYYGAKMTIAQQDAQKARECGRHAPSAGPKIQGRKAKRKARRT